MIRHSDFLTWMSLGKRIPRSILHIMATFDSNPTALSELMRTVLSNDLVYAAWRQDITEVMAPLPSNTFVKTPDYLS